IRQHIDRIQHDFFPLFNPTNTQYRAGPEIATYSRLLGSSLHSILALRAYQAGRAKSRVWVKFAGRTIFAAQRASGHYILWDITAGVNSLWIRLRKNIARHAR